jgi:radical SAM superfamily enzyme YgiQ (UPF0313 family)
MVDPDCIPPLTRLTVVLIKPSKYDDDGYVIRYRKGFLPSNTLSCLAGLTEDVRRRGVLGDSVTVTVQLFDDTVQPIPVARITRAARRKGNKTIIGLVGVQTNQVPRAADLALAFRREGVDVLLGGFHVSGSMAMLPAVPPEIQALIDAGVCLVLGEVEDQWGGILTDALRGALRPVYNFLGSPPDLRNQPLPRTDRRYLRRFVTANFGTIDCGRGCPFQCSFCTIINVQGRRMRCRDAETVVAGVRDNYRVNGVSFYFLTDDNFSRNPHWEAIFDGLIALREVERIPIEFMMQVDTLAYRIQGFIPKARRAGCTQVFIGLESLNPRNLAAVNKNQNKVEDLAQMVAAFHREEIMTHAAYIVGFPFDTRASVRQDIERLKNDLGVKQASFFMLIPLPGSHDHREMVKANIPMDPDLNRYDSVHATTDHPLMSADEWNAAFRDPATHIAGAILERVQEFLLGEELDLHRRSTSHGCRLFPAQGPARPPAGISHRISLATCMEPAGRDETETGGLGGAVYGDGRTLAADTPAVPPRATYRRRNPDNPVGCAGVAATPDYRASRGLPARGAPVRRSSHARDRRDPGSFAGRLVLQEAQRPVRPVHRYPQPSRRVLAADDAQPSARKAVPHPLASDPRLCHSRNQAGASVHHRHVCEGNTVTETDWESSRAAAYAPESPVPM